jgi:hypothetical protein
MDYECGHNDRAHHDTRQLKILEAALNGPAMVSSAPGALRNFSFRFQRTS